HRVPQQQLWRFSSWAPQDTTTNGVFITANTIATFAGDDATQMFYRPLAVYTQDGYTVDFWLRVNAVQQAHQGDDAGIVFYPSTTSLFAEVPPQNRDDRVYATLPRGQSIYFDADGIGWGDE